MIRHEALNISLKGSIVSEKVSVVLKLCSIVLLLYLFLLEYLGIALFFLFGDIRHIFQNQKEHKDITFN